MNNEQIALAITQVQFIKKNIDLEQEEQIKSFKDLYEKNIEILYNLDEEEPLNENSKNEQLHNKIIELGKVIKNNNNH